MNPETVVITGMGCLAPNGNTVAEFWDGLIHGRSGIRPVKSIDTSRHGRTLGGEVQNFDAVAELGAEVANASGRTSHLAIASAKMALKDAGVTELPRGTLVTVGSTMGDLAELERSNDQWFASGSFDAVDPELLRRHSPGGVAARVAQALRVEDGQILYLPNACSSGVAALAASYQLVRSGRVPMAVVGGSDAYSRICYTGFVRLGAAAPERCQPFDRDRKGMMVSEGAGMFVLETLASARKRGARIHAEIAGLGLSCDANHVTAPHPEGKGMASAMRKALKMANAPTDQVDYVGAHGTGTPANDKAESLAILAALGERGRTVAVSSIKSMIGHTMGAASALHAIACVQALAHHIVPPTINHETVDPECPVDCVPNVAREMPVRIAVTNSAAFGGNNACMALRSVA